MDADLPTPETEAVLATDAGTESTDAGNAGNAGTSGAPGARGTVQALLTAVVVLTIVFALVLVVGRAREDNAGTTATGAAARSAAGAATPTTTAAPTGGQQAAGDGHDHSHEAGASGDSHGTSATGDGHSHSHGESDASYDELADATKAQVEIARSIAERYPTAADAKKDGWIKATYNLEGIGSHYLKGGVAGFRSNDAVFDVNEPEILLFDGEGDDAPIAGVSYLINGEDPEGFEGDDDVWHRHSGVCFRGIVIAEVDGHEGSKFSMSSEQCREAGGLVFPIGNLTMLHVWVGKGYEGAPVFAHDNPKLYHNTPVGQPSAV